MWRKSGEVPPQRGVGFERTRETLRRLAGDADPEVRRKALRAMESSADPAFAELMLEVARNDPDEEFRARAAGGLGRLRGKDTFSLLTPFASDPSPKVQAFAITALGQTGDPRALEFLAAQLKRDDAKIRSAALRGLANLREPRVFELAKSYVQDPDAYVARMALYACWQSPAPNGFLVQLEALESHNPKVQDFAADRLKWLLANEPVSPEHELRIKEALAVYERSNLPVVPPTPAAAPDEF
ncbi:MAG: HEAT repeat domain-containing protein [Planctomycetota bacterium]|nr:HEAT repeat domain-containing protein [Planctomycetota bacterium]